MFSEIIEIPIADNNNKNNNNNSNDTNSNDNGNKDNIVDDVKPSMLVKLFRRWKHLSIVMEELIAVCAYFAAGIIFYKFNEDWSPFDSIFFIVQSIFTVGYGDLTPQKGSSRIFTMFYLLIGLGFVFQMLQGIMLGAIAYAQQKTLATWTQPARKDILKKYYWKLIWSVISIVVVLFIGVAGFMTLEKLSFIDAIYFTSYTITTVGYGDIKLTHQSSRIFCLVFIFISVTITAIALSHISSAQYEYRIQKKKIQMLSKELSIDLIREYDSDGDGVSKYEFIVGALTQLGLVNHNDINMWAQKFDELDVDHNGRLDLEDLERLQDYNLNARKIADDFKAINSQSILSALSSDVESTSIDTGDNGVPVVASTSSGRRFLLDCVEHLTIHFDEMFGEPDERAMRETYNLKKRHVKLPHTHLHAHTLRSKRHNGQMHTSGETLHKGGNNDIEDVYTSTLSSTRMESNNYEDESGTYHVIGIEGDQTLGDNTGLQVKVNFEDSIV